VESVSLHLGELVRLLQDDNTVRRPAASSALCYAAWAGSVPLMDTLIQKGVGKTLLQAKLCGSWIHLQPSLIPRLQLEPGTSTPVFEALRTSA